MLLLVSQHLFAKTLPQQLQQIEQRNSGRIGISVLNTGNQHQINYRANQRFPMGCTSKVIGVSAVLNKSMTDPMLLGKKITYQTIDLASWSPVTGKHVKDGMTVEALCSAAIRYSDNTAMNLLVKELGGLEAINAYAKQLGDHQFRQDNIWPDEAFSGGDDPYDSSSPAAMTNNLRQLLLERGLGEKQHKLLQSWMLSNTTGDKRIRAGVPASWKVADKTGTGARYGTTNDIGVIWPGACSPIVMSVYFTQNHKHATPNDRVIVDVTKSVIAALAEKDPCVRDALASNKIG
ncbi:Beta-lactamase CTX-M-1 precursor [Legionella spiritensis]|uniref:beta-lactamase n=1 Tax=Legionella spiritensis TaxID=452 RepID=A0A0W0YX14_LEGSP|nr:Beta-lactamase CTX-M-1 precursor [Legionella spiritensis]SNV33953.1 Beta-lactamase CTX-M-1 precursor [Legionella spiritensis]